MSVKKINPLLPKAREISYFTNKIDKNRYYSNYGPLYKQCEKQIIKYLGLSNKTSNILTSSGSSSILACLLHIRKRTKKNFVLVPSFSFYADVQCIILAGFKPIFVDVDSKEVSLDENTISSFFKNSKYKNKIAAAILVSPFGKIANLSLINKIQKKFKIEIVYDAANCFINLKNKIDRLNFFICCSFHPTKTFPANESGLIICNKKFKDELKSIVNFGIMDKNNKRYIIANGFNGKFSEYDAAILLTNLKKIKFIENKYKKLAKIIIKENLIKKYTLPGYGTDWLSNNLILNLDKKFFLKQIKELKKKKINFFYPWGDKAISELKIYKKYKFYKIKNSKKISRKLVSINLKIDLKIYELKQIIHSLKKCLN